MFKDADARAAPESSKYSIDEIVASRSGDISLSGWDAQWGPPFQATSLPGFTLLTVVAVSPLPDLLLCAKHLFVAAMIVNQRRKLTSHFWAGVPAGLFSGNSIRFARVEARQRAHRWASGKRWQALWRRWTDARHPLGGYAAGATEPGSQAVALGPLVLASSFQAGAHSERCY
jgi:hypothetical protein